MWERGLKQHRTYRQLDDQQSLPMWERGLKHLSNRIIIILLRRSPCGSVD